MCEAAAATAGHDDISAGGWQQSARKSRRRQCRAGMRGKTWSHVVHHQPHKRGVGTGQPGTMWPAGATRRDIINLMTDSEQGGRTTVITLAHRQDDLNLAGCKGSEQVAAASQQAQFNHITRASYRRGRRAEWPVVLSLLFLN